MGKITVELYLSTFGTLNHPKLGVAVIFMLGKFSYSFETILLRKLLVSLCVPATAMAAT